MRTIVLAILMLASTFLQAQDGYLEKLYVTPAISVGYTFGATFNIGIDLDLTTSVTKDFDKLRRAGISASHYFVLSRGGFQPHQITTFNLMFENERLDIKSGYGLMKYRWGRAQVNKWGLGAFSIDISFTNRENNIPWFGVKSLFYDQRQWMWFDTPYFSFYAKQKFYLTGGG